MQEGGVEGWLEVIRILVWIARRYVADEDLGCVGENGRKNERNRRRVQIFFFFLSCLWQNWSRALFLDGLKSE